MFGNQLKILDQFLVVLLGFFDLLLVHFILMGKCSDDKDTTCSGSPVNGCGVAKSSSHPDIISISSEVLT